MTVTEPAVDFTRDSAVVPLGDGAYAATVSTQWSAPPGPNGGYLAAIVLRAIVAEVADPARAPRSLTLHYLKSPVAGDVRVTVTVERVGRSLSTVTARLEQEGRLCIIALAACGMPFETAADYVPQMPAVTPWTDVEPWPTNEKMPAISQRLVLRPAVGDAPFSGSERAITGGWVALHETAPVDAVLLALLVDAWLPAPFPVLDTLVAAPTIDLTVHFRNPAAAAAHPADVPLLSVFESRTSQDGYFEEDGTVWTPHGVLLAQSRQLALLRPLPGMKPGGFV